MVGTLNRKMIRKIFSSLDVFFELRPSLCVIHFCFLNKMVIYWSILVIFMFKTVLQCCGGVGRYNDLPADPPGGQGGHGLFLANQEVLDELLDGADDDQAWEAEDVDP